MTNYPLSEPPFRCSIILLKWRERREKRDKGETQSGHYGEVMSQRKGIMIGGREMSFRFCDTFDFRSKHIVNCLLMRYTKPLKYLYKLIME